MCSKLIWSLVLCESIPFTKLPKTCKHRSNFCIRQNSIGLHVCWSSPSLCMVWCYRPVGLDSDDLVQIILPTCLYIGTGAPGPPTRQLTTVGWDYSSTVSLSMTLVSCNALYWTEPHTQCVEKYLVQTKCDIVTFLYMLITSHKCPESNLLKG